jgi:hypothetical protein
MGFIPNLENSQTPMECGTCNPPNPPTSSTDRNASVSLEQYVAGLASNGKVRDMANTYGLNVVSVSWEDIGPTNDLCYDNLIWSWHSLTMKSSLLIVMNEAFIQSEYVGSYDSIVDRIEVL